MADSDFDPRFGDPLNQLIAAANAQGIKTNVISGRRSLADQQQLYANYQAGQAGKPLPYPDRGPVPLAAKPGTSLHEQGLAADVEATDPSQQAALRALAPQFGLATIGPSDPNHFQIGKTSPAVAVANNSATPASNPYSFSLPANAPMGMGNNNPLNIKYYKGAPYAGLIGPSSNTDQGDPQMKFSSPEAGWSAGYSLLGRKYGSGMTTPNAIIAGKGGWTPGNTQAAANVAKAAGIGPDDDIGFNDPLKAQKFMRALVAQEQGAASAAYPDAMIQASINGKFTPGATPQASGPIDPSIIARGGYSPPIPGTTITATPDASTAGVLPGFPGKAQSDAFTQGATALDKAMHGDQSGGGQEGGQAAAFNFPQAHKLPSEIGSQIYGNTLTSMMTPLQWSSQSPGQNPYANAGGAPIGGAFGTQLGSLQQMQQMMAMMGNPYGDAGYG